MGLAFRPPRATLIVVALIAVAVGVAAASASAAGPGLPRTYGPRIIDTPNPLPGGSFGWGIASADLTGDGELDLLVAQAEAGKGNGGPGQIFIYNGVTGALVDTIDAPEQNPDAATPPTLGFVYVETMPDVGSCPGGDGPDADKICDAATVGAGDGTPEIIVGARNLRTTDMAPPAGVGTEDPRFGRGYIFDGATRAVLKRIDMPAIDRDAQFAISGAGVAPQFGRVMTTPSGLEPCAGLRSENNNMGVTVCPDKLLSERIGDVNGDNVADIVVTARAQVERTGPVPPGTPADVEAAQYAAAGTQCRNATTPATCTSGKAWVYSGAIAGSSPSAILDTPIYAIKNPRAQLDGGDFGGNMTRVGDTTGDGRPEFIIPARTLDYPLTNPDFPSAGTPGQNVGASFLINGATGALVRIIPSPEPQARSQFGGGFNSGRPVGDLGSTSTSDYIQAAPFQNALSTDDGKAWVFNGDLTTGGGAEQSWQFASLTDPFPEVGSNFGGALTGVGDLVSGPDSPTNEVLIGGFGFDPFTDSANNRVADLHFMNPGLEKTLQTVPHPEGIRGDGFGVGITPMGDLNDDGFLDFAASAYLTNLKEAGQGRAYIFTSDNSPLPSPPPGPAAETPVTPRVLLAGRCTNDTMGTNGADDLEGTIAGDRIFGFAGDDVIVGFQSEDCLQGGAGDDRLDGSGDNDKIVGDAGADNLAGGDGRDQLFGSTGNDRLSGGFSRDFLAGGSGNDTLRGGQDADRLLGERGNDRISTGDGRNKVNAGPGNDRINARNGERDDIICGAGSDVVTADPGDRVDGACEQVTRLRRRG